MWQLDHKEGWVPKNWCFWNVVLEKTLESPLGSKEIKSVYPKGYQPWIFIGWTAAEAETPILWPPDAKSWLTGKDLDAGKDWGQEKGWHRMRWLDGITNTMYVSLSKLGDSEGQGSLLCCSPWGHKDLDTTEQLNWTELIHKMKFTILIILKCTIQWH